MKIFILLAIVSVALAKPKDNGRQASCEQLERVDCNIFDENDTCDQNGKKYRNVCELMKAKCENNRLKRKDCPKPTTPKPTEGSGDKLSKFQERCAEAAKIDCSRQRWDKTCDNTGRVYRNKCAFRQAKCQNEELQRVRCPRPTTTEAPPTSPKPTRMGNADRKCRVLLRLDCSVYIGKNTMCDQDGKIYKNKCEVEQAKCLNKDMKLKKCKPEGSGDEPQFDEDDQNENQVACKQLDRVDCNIFDENPTCDQKGRKYRNVCVLMKAKCVNQKLRQKDCPKPTTPKPTKPTRPPTTEGPSGSGEVPTKFHKTCMKIAKTNCKAKKGSKMCDTDGRRYRNKCAFLKAKCQDETLKTGKCPRPSTTAAPPTTAKPTRMTNFQRRCTSVARLDCNAMPEKRICDQTGESYRNKCAFQQAKCANKDLKTKKCKPEGSGEKPQFDEEIEKPDQSTCRKLKFLTCSKFGLKEVCDQNGKSYRNKCAFLKAQCTNAKLVAEPCTEGSGEKFETLPPKPVKPTKPTAGGGDATEKFKAMCKKMKTTRCSYLPRLVCGSDGKTYKNSCLLFLTACKLQDESLSVASKGKCSN